ncbi:unnamed protein product [Phaedon cochleariae]|uniref:Uncharacterized protein n=1 Tax=Phaedon cochleariae TaxID=80249 RepID=A0A9N9X0V3_PHACE|nr:unnamed protein product [Phaedon cochleariae]
MSNHYGTTCSQHKTAYSRHINIYILEFGNCVESFTNKRQEVHHKHKSNYGVQDASTGDNRSKNKKRDSDLVKGYHTVDDPDGILRTLDYTADDMFTLGFNTVVEKQETPIYPAPAAYSAPVQNDQQILINKENAEGRKVNLFWLDQEKATCFITYSHNNPISFSKAKLKH